MYTSSLPHLNNSVLSAQHALYVAIALRKTSQWPSRRNNPRSNKFLEKPSPSYSGCRWWRRNQYIGKLGFVSLLEPCPSFSCTIWLSLHWKLMLQLTNVIIPCYVVTLTSPDWNKILLWFLKLTNPCTSLSAGYFNFLMLKTNITSSFRRIDYWYMSWKLQEWPRSVTARGEGRSGGETPLITCDINVFHGSRNIRASVFPG